MTGRTQEGFCWITHSLELGRFVKSYEASEIRGPFSDEEFVMEQQTVQQFKKLFLNLKKGELEQLKKLELEEAKLGDDAEKTYADRENQLTLKLKGRNRHYLKKIDQALERIEKNEFGDCDECGEEISIQRLFARPTATLCIACKEEQEGRERHIHYNKKSHTHGKELINDAAQVLSIKTLGASEISLNAI